MNSTPVRPRLMAAALFFCGAIFARGQIIELRATINASQEVPATTSPATGLAQMFYDVGTNRFDLFVTLDRFFNEVTDTHTQEGVPGETGPAQNHLGAESAYTRTGGTVSASFLNVRYPGDPMKLLRNGAYLNFHSAQFPRGEVRGQLITQPKRLVANITVAQEQAAFPGTAITSNAFGAAVMLYDIGTNQMSLRLNLYGFTNTLTNSHFHEGDAGVSGPVVVGIGAGTVNGYASLGNGWWSGSFDFPYTGGDAMKLLTGGTYLNFHSNVYPNGELRGQVTSSELPPGSRLTNLSARGSVGAGGQALIAGLSITAPEPIRVLITAKGPSLMSFGVAGALSDPVLTLADASNRAIATHDNTGALTVAPGSEFARIPGLPFNPSESMLLIVLPPGNYTTVVTGAGNTTGVALIEAVDLRTLGTSITN